MKTNYYFFFKEESILIVQLPYHLLKGGSSYWPPYVTTGLKHSDKITFENDLHTDEATLHACVPPVSAHAVLLGKIPVSVFLDGSSNSSLVFNAVVQDQFTYNREGLKQVLYSRLCSSQWENKISTRIKRVFIPFCLIEFSFRFTPFPY